MGSSKGGKRTKIVCNPFYFKGNEVTHCPGEEVISESHLENLLFAESLVSFVLDCKPFPRLIPLEPEVNRAYLSAPSGPGRNDSPLSDEAIDEALDLCAADVGCSRLSPQFPFAFRQLIGNIIDLKRLAPSWCNLCKIYHQAENPYLCVVDGTVQWHCRRSQSHGLGKKIHILGTLTTWKAEGVTAVAPSATPAVIPTVTPSVALPVASAVTRAPGPDDLEKVLAMSVTFSSNSTLNKNHKGQRTKGKNMTDRSESSATSEVTEDDIIVLKCTNWVS
jgi:hypothetical protein